jgi:hypothetical protein
MGSLDETIETYVYFMMMCKFLNCLYVLCVVALFTFWNVRGEFFFFSRVLSRVNNGLKFNPFKPSDHYTYHDIYQKHQVLSKYIYIYIYIFFFLQEFSIKTLIVPYTALIY